MLKLQMGQENYQSEVRLRMEADHSMDIESLLVRIEEEQQRFSLHGSSFILKFNLIDTPIR